MNPGRAGVETDIIQHTNFLEETEEKEVGFGLHLKHADVCAVKAVFSKFAREIMQEGERPT